MLPYQTSIRKEDGIVIVGLGGAGANILQRFSGSSAENVRLNIISLDERLGRNCGNVNFLQLGAGLNHGLGSGGDPEVGRQAVQESKEEIAAMLQDAKLLVMVVGLGGGTGSGVAPELAMMASEAGVFLVSVVVMPFTFEGRRRREQAEAALERIAGASDLVYCFENDYMEELFNGRSGVQAVFEEANTLLSQATASVPLFSNSPGFINIGLDELVAALRNNDSRCIFGSGTGFGARRAEDAARAALESPLVAYHGALRFAHTVIVHVAGGNNMSLTEIRRAMETIQAGLEAEDVQVFFGASVKEHLGEEMRVSLIASVDANEFKIVIEEEKLAALAAAQAAPEEPEEEEEPSYEDEETEESEENIFEEDEEDVMPLPATSPHREPEPPVATSRYAPPADTEVKVAAASRPYTRSLFDAPAPVAPAPEPEIEDDFNMAGTLADDDDPMERRVRSLFPDDEPLSTGRSYTPRPSQRSAEGKNDSWRNNDLRTMFPE